APVKQLDAKLLLQVPDLLAERRLRGAEAGRRMTEMQFLGDSYEISKVAELHDIPERAGVSGPTKHTNGPLTPRASMIPMPLNSPANKGQFQHGSENRQNSSGSPGPQNGPRPRALSFHRNSCGIWGFHQPGVRRNLSGGQARPEKDGTHAAIRFSKLPRPGGRPLPEGRGGRRG